MKTFDDFLNEIDDADLSQYLQLTDSQISPASPSDRLLRLSAAQTLYYLEKYHEWLCKALSE